MALQEAPKFPEHLKREVEEAMGNSMINSFKNVCRDVVCGCHVCRADAKDRKDYDGIPIIPDIYDAKKLLNGLEGHEIPILKAEEPKKSSFEVFQENQRNAA